MLLLVKLAVLVVVVVVVVVNRALIDGLVPIADGEGRSERY